MRLFFQFRLVLALLASSVVAAAQTPWTNIVAGFYTNAGPWLFIGDDTPFNALLVSEGGLVESGSATIGNRPNSHSNLARIEGAGSLWKNGSTYYLGDASYGNKLQILNGGRVDCGQAIIGNAQSSSNNSALVDGSLARWNSSELRIGVAGSSNSVILQRGGVISTGNGYVGFMSPTSRNQVTIADAGSTWNASYLNVGAYGSSQNRLLVSKGGAVFAIQGIIGNGDDNLITLSDPGSLCSLVDALFVGFQEGTRNSLILSNGSRMFVASAYVDGNQNSISVVGPDTLLETGGLDTQVVLGSTGARNTLLVTNAARLNSWSAYITGVSNTAEVVGAGSLWSNYLLLKAGDEYAIGNQLSIRDGARVDSYAAFVSGDFGKLILRGSNSVLQVGQLLSLSGGVGTSNTMVVADGATCLSGAATIGGEYQPFFTLRNNYNSARVTGSGSRWLIGSNLTIGATGLNNELRIENAGQVESQTGCLGEFSWSSGNSVLVSGINTAWKNSGVLYIGYAGWQNGVTVSNAAALVCSNAYVGGNYAWSNKVIVTGIGSSWDVAGALVVGNSGASNRVALAAGARLSTGSAAIDGMGFATPGRFNAVVVQDAGTEWISKGEIRVGTSSGFNELRIQNGAGVAAPALRLGNSPNGLGNQLSILGGSLYVTNQSQSGQLEVVQASLSIQAGTIYADRFLVSGAQASLDFRSGAVRARSMELSHDDIFTIGNGSDNAVLTTIALLSSATPVVVSSNSILEASGIVRGALTSAGTLKSGVPLQALDIQGALVLLESSEMSFEIAGVLQNEHDFLRVRQSCVLSGRLRLRLANGFVPASNDVIAIAALPAGTTGEFLNAPNGTRLSFENSAVSCRVAYTASEILLADFHNAKPASNEIDEGWALLYFGHAPLTAEERRADFDSDGLSTYEEYLAGTDPTDSASVLRIISIHRNALGEVVVRFMCDPSKNYFLASSLNLTTWGGPMTLPISNPGPGICECIPTAPMGSSKIFYRVLVGPSE